MSFGIELPYQRISRKRGPRGGYYLTNIIWHLYDENRVICDRNSANTPSVSYTRGHDLSGSLEGAGGIGGLLVRSHGYSAGNWSTHNYYHADALGNITFIISGGQSLAARYRYDPYGDTTSSSGSLATANVYRFSSKEYHALSGMHYYLYRWYPPSLQRWLNRDPIHEFGFLALKGRKLGFHTGSELNLYTFVGNNPISYIDVAGLKKRFGGLTGGKCCNHSGEDEWWLDGDAHKWTKLPDGKCTGTWDDCDGMTCGGGFYWVEDLDGGDCKTPGKDCPKYGPRRWTPGKQGPDAMPPGGQGGRGAPNNDPPPGYGWGIN